ncbi:release factor glutamine methyltransferase [Acidovorax delafieldii]|uniref:Release factor glutamine methyltransferase n=1 Tax=Acidovorax delafieldii TaxID=47920 RepID=A0AAJ2F0C4_ACIDE|nr:peptide chain release factor N(5)-glutamine methyltransferase [Acidovorax delafieldii]MDR6766561.1 release factor glutamine methyltransferase [Acidovorax delafieldii]MDR6836501.1 release factor glutamine methyltransferase [Acidovorax delafieldii]MDR7365992.1 release factor glutamine methyltransferase [Acidovorax delafieldii]
MNHTTAPTLAQALAQAHTLGLARIDAQLLLLHAVGRPDAGRAWLLAHDSDAMDDTVHTQFIALCQRRLAGEPVAYLTGRKEFYGLPLQVDARVLDPRPDTETLVDWALEVIAPLASPRVVDLGTGSGAIALALQSQRTDAQVLAVDASADALTVARANAERLGLPVRFQPANWLAGVEGEGLFDAIVSNPPYIPSADPHLAALTHEPLQALASGADGLEDIRTIVAQAPTHLRPGGWLLLEHGYDQAQAVQALLATHGFAQVQSRNDLAGIARCTGGQWPAAQTVK